MLDFQAVFGNKVSLAPLLHSKDRTHCFYRDTFTENTENTFMMHEVIKWHQSISCKTLVYLVSYEQLVIKIKVHSTGKLHCTGFSLVIQKQ